MTTKLFKLPRGLDDENILLNYVSLLNVIG